MKEKKREIFYILILYLVILLIPIVGKRINNDLFVFLEQPITVLVPTLLISYFYIKREGESIKKFYRLNSVSAKNIFIITCIVFLLPSIIDFVINISQMFLPTSSDTENIVDFLLPQADMNLQSRFFVFIYNTFFLAVFPGFCEEILFRGSIWRFSSKLDLRIFVMVLLNALLFAVFHWNLEQLYYTFALGVVLTMIAYKTNSIFASIYAHVLYNFIVDLSAYFLEGESKIIDFVSNVLYISGSMIFAPFAIILIIILLKKIKISDNIQAK